METYDFFKYLSIISQTPMLFEIFIRNIHK